jgi:hypothetical protein
MEEKVSRRSTEDKEWQETKRLARIRDKNMCVLCRLLTPTEYAKFQQSRPLMPMLIEVAHIEAVANHVEKVYDLDNVVCLCHAMHDRLDRMQDPVTGKNISKSVQLDWWQRIIEGRDRLASR